MEGLSSVKLLGYQHVILGSDGTNWYITSGETKREQVYVNKEWSTPEMEAGVEISATRPVMIVTNSLPTSFEVGGVKLQGEAAAGRPTIWVPPGQKIKATIAVKASVLFL